MCKNDFGYGTVKRLLLPNSKQMSLGIEKKLGGFQENKNLGKVLSNFYQNMSASNGGALLVNEVHVNVGGRGRRRRCRR